ncbi:MAG: M20/M25/M40 family metallo-hydrolase [Anaerolineae bacterium]|nr:M20/M25/M40 family metallo-hydrolase [Anaerolineae bacterium]
MIDLIRKLAECYGPSGHEEQIRAMILDQIDGLAEEVSVDALGNVIAWKHSSTPEARTIMLSAHMDEIGLIVTHIEEGGFMRFTNLGVLYPNTLYGNRVRFADGTVGVIGMDGNLGASSAPKLDQLYVDVSGGDHSIAVGDAAGLLREVVVRGERIVGKSLDNRVGCAIQIEVMRQVSQPAYNIAFAFTVQEEIGRRGAMTAAHAVDPEIGIAIDLTRTGDIPKAHKMAVEMGKGPAIKIKDGGMLASPEVIALLDAAAQRAGVTVQREILLSGTTDASMIQIARAGVKAGAISVPCRYVHTTSETVDLGDVVGAVEVLGALLGG